MCQCADHVVLVDVVEQSSPVLSQMIRALRDLPEDVYGRYLQQCRLLQVLLKVAEPGHVYKYNITFEMVSGLEEIFQQPAALQTHPLAGHEVP